MTSATNPFLALLVLLAFGLWIIRFARSCYRNPYIMLARWYSYVPQKNWTRRLLQSVSVIWIFGGFMMIGQGVVGLPFLEAHRGVRLGFVVTGTAILGTILVLWSARRQSVGGKIPTDKPRT